MSALPNRAARRRLSSKQRLCRDIDGWAESVMAEARAQGRALPHAAVSPEMPDPVFLGTINALSRQAPATRFLHCLECAREELRKGDPVRAEHALRVACNLMPREDEDCDAFSEETGGHRALDALEFSLWACEDRNTTRALGLIDNFLSKRSAA